MTGKRSPKISCYQAAAIIIVCRIFLLMTHIPLINDGYTAAEQLLALAVSTIIAAVLLIPSTIFYSKSGGESVIDSINSKSRTAGFICAVIAAVYLIIACASDIWEFSDFINIRFTIDIPESVIALIISAVCLYCAFCGAEGIARSAGAVLVLFLIMVFFMLQGSADKADLENIRTGLTAKNTLSAAVNDLAHGTELGVLCLMGKFIRKDYRRGAYSAIAARLILSAGVTFSALLILGDYAYICSYPFLDIGSAAGISFLQRIDSVYMIIWTITAALTISLKIFIGTDVIRTFLPEKAPCTTIFTAAAYGLSLCGIILKARISNNVFMLSLLTAIAVVIPLTALASGHFADKKGGLKIAEKRS